MNKLITTSIIAFLGLIIAFSCFKVIPAGNVGVSVTLGKVGGVKTEGPNFKAPFIEKLVIVPIKQITESGETPCFSSDLQTVTVSYSVFYRLPKEKVAELYQQFAGDPYHTLIRPRIESALKEVTSNDKAEDIVRKRDIVKVAALQKLQTSLSGLIDIRDVTITDIGLSRDLSLAIEAKQVRQQEALAKEYDLQKAAKEAEITVTNAKAEAEAITIKGRAIKESPSVVELEIIKRWNGVSPQTVVTSEGGANVVLPIKK